MGRVREKAQAMGRVMRRSKKALALFVVLRLIVLACAVGALVFGNYEAFFLCLLTLVLFLVPPFIEASFSITIPETLEVVIALFIFAAEILGELFHFYTLFPFWDTLLHTFNGFLAAAIGLALVERKVRALFVAEGAYIPGGFDDETGEVFLFEREPHGRFQGPELADAFARAALAQDAEVFELAPEKIPGDSGMAALYRY